MEPLTAAMRGNMWPNLRPTGMMARVLLQVMAQGHDNMWAWRLAGKEWVEMDQAEFEGQTEEQHQHFMNVKRASRYEFSLE